MGDSGAKAPRKRGKDDDPLLVTGVEVPSGVEIGDPINENGVVAETFGATGTAGAGPLRKAPSARRARGPRGERGEVRDRIRESAREEFIREGYDGATMRSIARRSGCDPAMVSYYFGSKQRLFRECFGLPLDPASEVLALLMPGIAGAGERIVRFGLELYDQQLTSETMQALMRALMTDAATSNRFRRYIREAVLDKVAEALAGGAVGGRSIGQDGLDEVAELIELGMAMMYGVVTMRYVVRLEPLASVPREVLVAELSPILQSRLDRVAERLGL